MHCTLYAAEALRAGFGENFNALEKKHKEIWGEREFAGWSMGYILVKFYQWKAYLFVRPDSPEYSACKTNFTRNKTYAVWKQPAIPLAGFYDLSEEYNEADSLLKTNDFGWGFSYQGWHTWWTRQNVLKECNWAGAPGARYEVGWNAPLFAKTRFLEYFDYDSHVVVFPPKQNL